MSQNNTLPARLPLRTTPAKVETPELTLSAALGLLMLMAIGPAAAQAANDLGIYTRGLTHLSLLGDLLLTPAFMFLAGLVGQVALMSDPVTMRRLFRLMTALGLASGMAAVAAGFITGAGFGKSLAQDAPSLKLIFLPLLFALTLRPLQKSSLTTAACIAVFLHIAGVVLGGALGAVLTPYIFFVAGVFFAPWRENFLRRIGRAPEYALAGGVFAVAATMILAKGVPLAHGAPRLSDVGPALLPLGLAAGPILLGIAWTSTSTSLAVWFADCGRAAPTVAIGWLPLFYATLAHLGAKPSPASLFLLALATFGLAFFGGECLRSLWATHAFSPDAPRRRP